MTPAGMSTRPVATARSNDRRSASQSMTDHSPGRTKPYRRKIFPCRRLLQEQMERPRRFAGTPEQDRALAQRFVPALGDQHVIALPGEIRRQRERQREDSGLRGAGNRELCGLRDVLAQDQPGDERVPESFVLERLPRRAAIRSVLGIGDREAPQPAVVERGTQVRQRRIRLYRRALRHEEHDAARRVALPPSTVRPSFASLPTYPRRRTETVRTARPAGSGGRNCPMTRRSGEPSFRCPARSGRRSRPART